MRSTWNGAMAQFIAAAMVRPPANAACPQKAFGKPATNENIPDAAGNAAADARAIEIDQ